MKVAHGALVAVIDGQKFVFYRNSGDSTRPVLEVLAHETEPHPRTSAMGTDQPGRAHSGPSHGRSAYSETDLHAAAETDFLVRAAERLMRLVQEQAAKALIILAPPHALGQLRRHWSPALKEKLVAEFAHEATQLTSGELVEMLEAHRAPPQA